MSKKEERRPKKDHFDSKQKKSIDERKKTKTMCVEKTNTNPGFIITVGPKFAKFLFVSMVASQEDSAATNLAFTCSYVRFRCRMGGVFKPEMIATIVE